MAGDSNDSGLVSGEGSVMQPFQLAALANGVVAGSSTPLVSWRLAFSQLLGRLPLASRTLTVVVNGTKPIYTLAPEVAVELVGIKLLIKVVAAACSACILVDPLPVPLAVSAIDPVLSNTSASSRLFWFCTNTWLLPDTASDALPKNPATNSGTVPLVLTVTVEVAVLDAVAAVVLRVILSAPVLLLR